MQQHSSMQTRAGPAAVTTCAGGWSQHAKNVGFSMALELVGKATTEGSTVGETSWAWGRAEPCLVARARGSILLVEIPTAAIQDVTKGSLTPVGSAVA